MLSASSINLRKRAASLLPGLATKLKARKHLAACLATGACALATALPANASLTFNWSWDLTFGTPTASAGTVSGSISGLLDNEINQVSGLNVTVDQAPNAPNGGWVNSWTFDSGFGFDVSGGAVTAFDAIFRNSEGDILEFGTKNVTLAHDDLTIANFGDSESAIFTPQSGPTPVPGPLPVIGAGAAFGWSRKLRQRLKVVTNAS